MNAKQRKYNDYSLVYQYTRTEPKMWHIWLRRQRAKHHEYGGMLMHGFHLAK